MCPRESLQIFGWVEPRGVAAEGDAAALPDPLVPVGARAALVSHVNNVLSSYLMPVMAMPCMM
jgi:hypothetical protein